MLVTSDLREPQMAAMTVLAPRRQQARLAVGTERLALPARAVLAVVILLLGGAASAQAEAGTDAGAEATAQDLFRVTGASAAVEDGAIVVQFNGREEIYVPGIGWLSGLGLEPPTLVGDEVLMPGSLIDALGITLPRLVAIRTSGEAQLRVVLDVPALDPTALAGVAGKGVLAEGERLTLDLPALLLPAEEQEDLLGIEFQFRSVAGGTRLELAGPPLSYEYFVLAHPTRVVIDLMPQRELNLPEVDDTLSPGVRYQRFNFMTASGGSVVHVVSIAPGSGQFRVVGESQVPRTVTQLASGSSVAVNAGYFDTATFGAIGYLLVDDGLLSLPSRNRASIAFGNGTPLIDRLTASVKLHTKLGLIEVGNVSDGVAVVTTAGALAGRPDMGVLVVRNGVVVENKIGPRQVPTGGGGYALVYPPTNRRLALLDTGDVVLLDTSIEPVAFDDAHYAVEAGPLLLKGGRPAFEPTIEGFATGQRILDALTQQAAVGVTPDGTTLLVVGETMKAEELISLFMTLGASDAMRLDSGSSTTLVIDGRVVNRGSERRVVSAIVFIPNHQ